MAIKWPVTIRTTPSRAGSGVSSRTFSKPRMDLLNLLKATKAIRSNPAVLPPTGVSAVPGSPIAEFPPCCRATYPRGVRRGLRMAMILIADAPTVGNARKILRRASTLVEGIDPTGDTPAAEMTGPCRRAGGARRLHGEQGWLAARGMLDQLSLVPEHDAQSRGALAVAYGNTARS